jgi:hypothetical protein
MTPTAQLDSMGLVAALRARVRVRAALRQPLSMSAQSQAASMRKARVRPK